MSNGAIHFTLLVKSLIHKSKMTYFSGWLKLEDLALLFKMRINELKLQIFNAAEKGQSIVNIGGKKFQYKTIKGKFFFKATI